MSGPNAESAAHADTQPGAVGWPPADTAKVYLPDPAAKVTVVNVTLPDGTTHVATAGPGRHTIIGADPRLSDAEFARMCAEVEARLPADVRPYVTVVVATNLKTLA